MLVTKFEIARIFLDYNKQNEKRKEVFEKNQVF